MPSAAVHAEQVPDDAQRIEDLTNATLHKEIDLERFYLQYRLTGGKSPKYRRMRFFLLQVASASCSVAAQARFIKLAANSLKHNGDTDFGIGDSDPNAFIDNLKTGGGAGGAAHNGNGSATQVEIDEDESADKFARHTFITSMIAASLDGGSALIELSSNMYTAWKNSMHQRSPGAALAKVIARTEEIDQLMSERSALIDKQPNSDAHQLYLAEGRVLQSFRDWCLSEFADGYADIKSNQSSNNVYYILAIAGDCLYISSMILAIKSLTAGKEHFAGPSTITGVVSDAIGVASAPAGAMANPFLYKHFRERLKQKLQHQLLNKEDETRAAMKELKKEIDSVGPDVLHATGSVQHRTGMYLLWSDRYDQFIAEQVDELHHQSRVALQDEFTGPAVTGTYLTQDILGTIAFYGNGSLKTGAKLDLAGGIAACPGACAGLGLTNLFLVNEILFRRKLRKRNELPEQLLAQRLSTLDELDAMLATHEHPIAH
jgi:hypothetical protein